MVSILQRLGAGIFALCAACDGGASWDAHASVRPSSSAWDHADIRIHGSRPRGVDIGDTCDGTIAVADSGVTRTLGIRVAGAGATVTETAPPGLVLAGSPLDAAALQAASPAMSVEEAEDVLRILDAACAGPKAGLPVVPKLIVTAVEQRYR
jgi:hypothetical protein